MDTGLHGSWSSSDYALGWARRRASEIAGKMAAENARDWSDEEIERCLRPCVCGARLVVATRALRDAGEAPEIYPYPVVN